MKIVTEFIDVATLGFSDIIDLTEEAQQRLAATGLETGAATFFASGATAGITTIEYEPGLLKDLPDAFEKNGASHVRAAMLGPSLVVPFVDGRLLLGMWQHVVLVDFDTRPRERKVVMQISGE